MAMNRTKECFTLLIALLLTMLCSCGRNAKIMDEAERIVEQSPDSSLALLSTVDRYSLSKSDRARYGLLFTMAQDKSGVDVDMDTLIRQSYIYYKGEPETKYYGLSQYYMGKYYNFNDSTRNAETCFKNAIKNAKDRCDIDLQCFALEKLSRSIVLGNTPMSLSYAKQALELYKRSPNFKVDNLIYFMLNVAENFVIDKSKDSALTYLWQAKSLMTNTTDVLVKKDVYHSLSRAFYYFDVNDSALFYSQRTLQLVNDVKLLSFHAYCLIECDSLESAERLLRISSAKISDKQKYSSYMELCKLSCKKNNNRQLSDDIDSLERYAEKYMLDLYSQKGKYFEETINQGRQLERQENAVMVRNGVILFIIVTVLLLAALVYVYLSKRKTLHAQEVRHIQEHYEMELESQRKEKEYLEREHKLLLESKNKQIALLKNGLFERLELAKKIKDAKGQSCHVVINDNDWNQLHSLLEGGEEYFVSKLKERYPSLSNDEIQMCMLIRIGLSNEDMANIYCITINSMKRKLYSFKEKMGITDKDQSVRNVILGL